MTNMAPSTAIGTWEAMKTLCHSQRDTRAHHETEKFAANAVARSEGGGLVAERVVVAPLVSPMPSIWQYQVPPSPTSFFARFCLDF